VIIGAGLVWTSGPPAGFANNARGFEALLAAHWRLGWWGALPLAVAAMVKLELSFRQHNRTAPPFRRDTPDDQ
jgi:hypothetical protein